MATDDARIKAAVESHGIAGVYARRPSDRHRSAGRGGATPWLNDARSSSTSGRRAAASPTRSGRWPTFSTRIPMRRSQPHVMPSKMRPRRSIRTWSRSSSTIAAALYFSRATIPAREAFADGRAAVRTDCDLPALRPHAYRARFLRSRYPTLAPAAIERFEALEQLRALWHGFRIVVEVTAGTPAPGVDTQEDLERVRTLFASGAV